MPHDALHPEHAAQIARLRPALEATRRVLVGVGSLLSEGHIKVGADRYYPECLHLCLGQVTRSVRYLEAVLAAARSGTWIEAWPIARSLHEGLLCVAYVTASDSPVRTLQWAIYQAEQKRKTLHALSELGGGDARAAAELSDRVARLAAHLPAGLDAKPYRKRLFGKDLRAVSKAVTLEAAYVKFYRLAAFRAHCLDIDHYVSGSDEAGYRINFSVEAEDGREILQFSCAAVWTTALAADDAFRFGWDARLKAVSPSELFGGAPSSTA